jgi:hypothetical protein
MSRVVVRNLVDPSYTCIIFTTTRSLLSFLFRVHQGEIAADACVPGSTRPDEGQARPVQQLETTPPTGTPTTSPPLRLLEHSRQKAACPGPQEEDGVGIDRIGCHRHTLSLCLLHHSTLSLFNHARPFPVLLQREA